MAAVDHLIDEDRIVPPGVSAERYEVVANFLSHPRNRRIRTICELPAAAPEVATIVDLYPGIAFAERETFDLFGVNFLGHDDLARILMPDDWIGHPLRKDDSPSRVPVTFKEDPSPTMNAERRNERTRALRAGSQRATAQEASDAARSCRRRRRRGAQELRPLEGEGEGARARVDGRALARRSTTR